MERLADKLIDRLFSFKYPGLWKDYRSIVDILDHSYGQGLICDEAPRGMFRIIAETLTVNFMLSDCHDDDKAIVAEKLGVVQDEICHKLAVHWQKRISLADKLGYITAEKLSTKG